MNELTIESALPILLQRLRLPEGEVATEAELKAELEKYKSELIAAEEARIADLKSRFEALSDVGLLQGLLGISNIAAHFRDNVMCQNAEEAEQSMILLESQYSQALLDIQSVSWLQSRQIEYAKLDKMLLEGLAEDAAGRPDKLHEYLQLREQIKAQYPKPE